MASLRYFPADYDLKFLHNIEDEIPPQIIHNKLPPGAESPFVCTLSQPRIHTLATNIRVQGKYRISKVRT